jgi:hypothetical protein
VTNEPLLSCHELDIHLLHHLGLAKLTAPEIMTTIKLLQVILFEIDCVIFYTNLHELFRQFISWINWVNSGKFMDNCWIQCQVMANMKKVYDDLIIINLYASCKIDSSWNNDNNNIITHIYHSDKLPSNPLSATQ